MATQAPQKDLVDKLVWIAVAAVVVAATGSGIGVSLWSFTGWLWLDLVVAVLGSVSLVCAIILAVRTKDDVQLPWPVLASTYAALIAASYIAIRLETVTELNVAVDGESFQWFALLFVLALAIERTVEPLMQSKVTGEKKDDQKSVEVRKSRAVVAFLVSATVGLVLAGLLNLGLIEAVAEVGVDDPGTQRGWLRVFDGVDVVVTGLAIGAGTKPLHDLISAIQKKAG